MVKYFSHSQPQAEIETVRTIFTALSFNDISYHNPRNYKSYRLDMLTFVGCWICYWNRAKSKLTKALRSDECDVEKSGTLPEILKCKVHIKFLKRAKFVNDKNCFKRWEMKTKTNLSSIRRYDSNIMDMFYRSIKIIIIVNEWKSWRIWIVPEVVYYYIFGSTPSNNVCSDIH